MLDIFSGSAVVSHHLKGCGFQVIANDFLYFCHVLARGTLPLNAPPAFDNLPCKDPLSFLNSLAPTEADTDTARCFIYRHYAPHGACERRYFTPENALKIDVVRQTIEGWREDGRLDDDAYHYLLAALIQAVPFVANITGTYGAYLKYWDKRALNPLRLVPPPLVAGKRPLGVYNADYTALLDRECDVLYADPPYNSREYLPNYHVLETIARYDNPTLHGVTGLRDYADQKSPFCKKATVAAAFATLLRETRARYVIISYNNEGLLPTEELQALCAAHAVNHSFSLQEFAYRRYKNKIPNNAKGLKEQLYIVQRV